MNIPFVNDLKRVATSTAGRSLLKVKKYSPEILTVVGVAGLVTAGVLAAKKTLSLEHTVDNAKNRIDWTRDEVETGNQPKKAMALAYAEGGLDIAKLYYKPVLIAGVSIACIAGGQNILRKRNVALAAAYNAVSTAYTQYRERVIEELGEEKDREFRYGVTEEKVLDTKGKEKTVKVLGDPNNLSEYTRIFDEYNPNWQKTSEYNKLFVTQKQNYFNDLLRARGHVFLNEVYDALGFEHSSAGQVVGWIIGKEGDNYIDFGLYETRSSHFINGDEASIILDFNVDGVIFDLID